MKTAADAFDELWASLDDSARAQIERTVDADIGRNGMDRLSREELTALRRDLAWAQLDPAGFLKARRAKGRLRYAP
ncbi:MAG: hypothetical protein ACOYXN_13600 [Acidobacteriota bacterium]